MEHLLAESTSKCYLYKSLMGIFAVLSFILLWVCAYYSVRIFKIYRWTNVWLCLFMFALFLWLLVDTIYGINEVIITIISCDTEVDNWRYGIFSYLNFVLYLVTIIINTFNWIFQLQKLKEKSSGQRKSTIHLWVLLSMFTLFYIAIFWVFVGSIWTRLSQYSFYDHIFGNTVAASYVIVGIIFPSVCYLFYKKFKIVWPTLCQDSRTRIIVSVASIGIIFMSRGIIAIFRVQYHFMRDIVKQDISSGNPRYPFLNFTYYFIASLVPSSIHIIMLRYLIFDSNARHKYLLWYIAC